MEEKYMYEALKQAKKAYAKDEVPIGAIIVLNGKIIARAHNYKETYQSTIAHAEIEAIKKACKKVKSWRLEDCDLYVTLEPCPMCAGAIQQARIRNVYFGAYDKKGGVLGTLLNLYDIKGFNHYPNVFGGVLAEACGNILSEYFRAKREEKKQVKSNI